MLSWTCVLRAITRVLLWRSLKELVVQTENMLINRYGRQLLARYCCEKEACNAHDCYAVAVKVTGTTDIVGHLPWKLSRVCLHFLH